MGMIYMSANLALWMVSRSGKHPRDIFKCNLIQTLWDIAHFFCSLSYERLRWRVGKSPKLHKMMKKENGVIADEGEAV